MLKETPCTYDTLCVHYQHSRNPDLTLFSASLIQFPFHSHFKITYLEKSNFRPFFSDESRLEHPCASDLLIMFFS